jgi:hypothetical protein
MPRLAARVKSAAARIEESREMNLNGVTGESTQREHFENENNIRVWMTFS